MKKVTVLFLLVLLTVGLFVSCSSSSAKDDGLVELTLDFRTYFSEISDMPLYIDKECTTNFDGVSHTFTIEKGSTLADITIYYLNGDTVIEPRSLKSFETLAKLAGLDGVFFDSSNKVFSCDTPITEDMTLFAKNGVGCVAEGCKITLADGTKKNVEDIVLGEELLTWDFYTGALVAKRVISIDKTASTTRPVITITTNGGTEINIVDVQAFFDMDAREYFNISNLNYKRHIGKNIMICDDGQNIKSEKILSIVLHDETLELYDLITEDSLNFISDDALTIVPLLFSITPYEVDENYKYDAVKMAQDRARYGLTSYEAFRQYASQEAFEKLRLEEVQILLGKGLISKDYLKYVINKFLVSTQGIR